MEMPKMRAGIYQKGYGNQDGGKAKTGKFLVEGMKKTLSTQKQGA